MNRDELRAAQAPLKERYRSDPAAALITLKAEPVDYRVRFAVIDQGSGIPEEHQTRIFDRFFRVPGDDQNGVGLGLAIAKEIVTAHGGVIGVRSVPGQGAEFFFALPQVSDSQ